jgi:hypothetical protein
MAVKTLIIHETDAHQPRKVLVIDIGGDVGEASGQRPARAANVPLRTQDDAGQDGPKDPRDGR